MKKFMTVLLLSIGLCCFGSNVLAEAEDNSTDAKGKPRNIVEASKMKLQNSMDTEQENRAQAERESEGRGSNSQSNSDTSSSSKSD